MAFPVLVAAALAWGALAFGAVYAWGYASLIALAAAIGVVGLVVRRGGPPRMAVNRPVAAALAGLALALALQIVPLPAALLERVSPHAPGFLARHSLVYAAAPGSPHPASLDPATTLRLLAGLGALGVLQLAVARRLSARTARGLVELVMGLGVLLALIAIVQAATWNGKIYGFWTPTWGTSAFGPFVNRNHFAGWMLMALPLAVGYLAGRVAQGAGELGPALRDRVLYLGSADASRTVLAAGAVLVMGLSLVLTLSRSGVTCFLVAMTLMGGLALRRQATTLRRGGMMLYLAAVAVAAIAWTGVDRLADRFGQADLSLNGRLGAWQDALAIAADFPLTGTGIGTFSDAMLYYQKTMPEAHFGEAHNDYLQLVVEGGVLVAVPALVLLVILVREVRRRFKDDSADPAVYWLRAGAATGLIAIGLQEIGEFSLQMPGNAALFAVLLGIAIGRMPSRVRRAAGERIKAVCTAP